MSVSGQVMGVKKALKKEQLRRYATNRTTRLSSFYFKYHLLNQMCSSKSSTFSFSKAWILTIIIITIIITFLMMIMQLSLPRVPTARKLSASLALEKKMLDVMDVFAIFPCP